jgi:nicotinamide-nucleotide amidase
MTVDLEIVCVGNELLIGKVENTNSYWLVKQATSLGVNVKRITVIEDTVEVIGKTICEVVDRKPHFVITTGGLGPTFDDKTLQGIAAGLKRKLEVNQTALAMVKQKIEEYARKRKMPEIAELTPPQVKMATLPKDTQPVTNPIGSAPAVRVDLPGTVLFALPGVPTEMMAIFIQSIVPLLKVAVGSTVFCQRSLFVFDMAESRLAPLIDTVMKNNSGVYVKSHPLAFKGRLRIEAHMTITASTTDEPAEKLRKAAEELSTLVKQSGGSVEVGKE